MSPPELPAQCPGAEHCPALPPHVKLTDETIQYLRDIMRESVSQGFKGAMTPEAAQMFWTVGLELAQQQARIKAGRFVLDGIWAVARKAFWILVFLAAVHAIGGWTLVSTAWKAVVGR